MKPFAERNPLIMGAIGLGLTAGIVVIALQYDKIPFINQANDYSAYFAEAGGLTTGARVQVSGLRVGEVSSIELDGPRVLVKFTVDNDIRIGDRTEAAIKTRGLLGTKILEVTSRGDGRQDGTIPVERTTSPYQLPDALGDLATTISGLNTNQLSDSLRVLAETFSDTPPDLRIAVEGVARFSETLNERDAQLRQLLTNANKSTAVLAERSDQVVGLVQNTNALLVQLESQSAALDQISGNISALSQQLEGFIAENRETMRPALDKLNGVLTIIDNRKERVQKGLKLLDSYAMSLGRIGVLRSVLQELHRQPAAGPVRAAVHRRRVLRSRPGSQCVAAVRAHRPADRPAGHSGAAGALSADRAGWRAASDAARCHHRQPRRSGVRSARLAAARPHWLLPLPRAAARSAAGRPAAGAARARRLPAWRPHRCRRRPRCSCPRRVRYRRAPPAEVSP